MESSANCRASSASRCVVGGGANATCSVPNSQTLPSKVSCTARALLLMLVCLLCDSFLPTIAFAAEPIRPPSNLRAEDVPNDAGTALKITWDLSPDDNGKPLNPVARYMVHIEGRTKFFRLDWNRIRDFMPPVFNGGDKVVTYNFDVSASSNQFVFTEAKAESTYSIAVQSVPADRSLPKWVSIQGVKSKINWFNNTKLSFAIIPLAVCGAVIVCTELARRGKPFYVRPIAGLQAIEEAVGRATEMGKPMLFVPGIQDMNEIDTVAGLTVLSSVAKLAAEYDTALEVPTTRSLVMTAAREAVQAAALAAGRPDYYNEDRIYYVTDEQFGYVASVCGWMYREKPAACFYLGKFYAESLILAETGNAVGAIQIAGTAETSQLPFFVAACDYTLLGEELFAASAYLSGEPSQLGMLKGQDLGKLGAMVLIVVGCLLATWDGFSPRGTDDAGKPLPGRASFITETILNSG